METFLLQSKRSTAGHPLGPHMFLLFINNIGDDIDFSSDCLLFQRISDTEYTTDLLKVMSILHEWSNC